MQVTKSNSTDSQVVFNVVASTDELEAMKRHVLTHFQDRVKVPGFRAGKVPSAVLERNINSQQLQTEFLQEAIEQMYYKAVDELKIRPLEQPKVAVKKFVPYDALEFEATVSVIGPIKLADYKRIKKIMPQPKVKPDDIDNVIESLRQRLAEKLDVNRTAQTGDQVWIDFSGTDSKGKPVKGADGKDYPLALGSKTFIPGFEENLLGLKPGEAKEFTLTFPKTYQVSALANKKVTFTVKINKVQEVKLPDINDEFAKKVGPFANIKELRADIEKQLTIEQRQQVQQKHESELVREISEKSTLIVPEVMVQEQVEKMLQEQRQNLAYRGQTYEEFLKDEGKTEAQYRNDVLVPQATERVRASLVLSEIAEAENVSVTPQELDDRMQELSARYKDAAMQAELVKPEVRRDIAARLLTEKTIAVVVDIASRR